METNPELELAWKFLEQTGTHIFLTGRAGTGKTTFLRELRQRSPKRMIVVAPTGVAAINAGGVTIHSFFQLPFGPYVPALRQSEGGRLKMNFNREKIAIIRSLDLLVIDEISMVRADLLDAVNDVLQRYRDRSKPFGGVQLLLIGDLQQLAPVVRPQEWELLRSRYDTPYFFSSRALGSTEYVTLELQHVYRQRDRAFIDLLNRVRENRIDAPTLERLNARCIPGFEPDGEAGYITLTAHNETARAINSRRLDELDAPAYTFACETEGDFPELLYPNDPVLTLKRGAQVMFIRNDTSGLHRYFNGKIGRITAIGGEGISVTPDDQQEPIDVEIAEWTNTKYAIDPSTQEITETVAGVYRQYPLKAAWAITIHKSQGLTFERAIIDAADSFSHGQVYVALSRCRSFEGLVLRTPLPGGAIISDEKVLSFSRRVAERQPDETLFAARRRAYFESLVLDLFDFAPLRGRLQSVRRVFAESLHKLYPGLTAEWDALLGGFSDEVVTVSYRFHAQLRSILAAAEEPERDERLTARIVSACGYFREKCAPVAPLLERSHVEIDNKEVRKQLTAALGKAEETLSAKTAVLGMDLAAGFTIHGYLAARALAAIGEPKTKAAKKAKEAKEAKVSVEAGSEAANPALFERLRTWRRETAEREGVPAYAVLHQAPLLTLCKVLPRNGRELCTIKGIGKAFLTKYGEEVLELIAEWTAGNGEE